MELGKLTLLLPWLTMDLVDKTTLLRSSLTMLTMMKMLKRKNILFLYMDMTHKKGNSNLRRLHISIQPNGSLLEDLGIIGVRILCSRK